MFFHSGGALWIDTSCSGLPCFPGRFLVRKKLVSHQVDGVILRVTSHTYSFASLKEKKTCMGNCEGALFYTDHNFLGHLPLNGIYDSFYVFPRFFLKHQFISISLGDGIKHIKHGREVCVFFWKTHSKHTQKNLASWRWSKVCWRFVQSRKYLLGTPSKEVIYDPLWYNRRVPRQPTTSNAVCLSSISERIY